MSSLKKFHVHFGRRVFFALVLLSVVALTASCGAKKPPRKKPTKNDESSVVDFAKTQILVVETAVADGTDELAVIVSLIHSNGKPEVGFTPTYTVTSGTGVIAGTCTPSSSFGASTCKVRATVSGTKRIELTNAKSGLAKDIVFTDLPPAVAITGVVTGSNQHGVTAGGYKTEITAGSMGKSARLATQGGFDVFMTVQGALISR